MTRPVKLKAKAVARLAVLEESGLATVLRAALAPHCVALEDVMSERRHRHIAEARRTCYRVLTSPPLNRSAMAAAALLGVDHTSVSHGLKIGPARADRLAARKVRMGAAA